MFYFTGHSFIVCVHAEVLVEFDPTSYETAEGQDVMFRIIKRTSSSRNVTVIFSTRPATANGMDYKLYKLS